MVDMLTVTGAAMVAMTGDKCVSIATDKRFGVQSTTMAANFQKIFEFGPYLYLGLPGVATDTLTVHEKLRFRKNMYELKENHRVTPRVFCSMVGNFLYEQRFAPYFVEPIVAGLVEEGRGDCATWKPYICGMDLIGSPTEAADFVVAGTASEQLYGTCEGFWKPAMKPEKLFEVTAQALINGFDRDAFSGWGAVVYVIENDKVTVREIKTRMD